MNLGPDHITSQPNTQESFEFMKVYFQKNSLSRLFPCLVSFVGVTCFTWHAYKCYNVLDFSDVRKRCPDTADNHQRKADSEKMP